MIDIQPIHRRAAARHAVALECETVRASGEPAVSQQLLDLSSEGAFIKTDECEVELGEEVWLTFHLPTDDAWMGAHAKVVRYGRESFHGEQVWGVGVHFIDLDAPEHDFLAQSLAALPPPIPTATRPVDYASFVQRVDEGAA